MKKKIICLVTLMSMLSLTGCKKENDVVAHENDYGFNKTTSQEQIEEITTDEITIEEVTTEEIEAEEATNSDASGEFDATRPLDALPSDYDTFTYNGANVDWYHTFDIEYEDRAFIWDNNAKIKMEVSPWIWYDPDTFIDTWPSDGVIENGKSYCELSNAKKLIITNPTYGEIQIVDFALGEETWYEENIAVNNEAFFIASKEEFLSFFNSIFDSKYDATSYDYDVVETLPNGDRVRTIQVNNTTSTIEGQPFVGYVRMIMPADASHCYFIFYGENPLNSTNAASDTLRCINSVQVFE